MAILCNTKYIAMMKKSMVRIAIRAGIMMLIPLILFLLAIWHWRPAALFLAVLLLLGGVGLACKLLTKKRRGAYWFGANPL